MRAAGRLGAALLVAGSLGGSAEAADFKIGSYGRMGSTWAEGGAAGAPLDIGTHHTRTDLDPYAELDFVFTEAMDSGARFRAVLTPAIAGQPFHATGDWDADLAVRNLYAEVHRFVDAPVSAWVGSRMWRGDDVYLLNFWPLDNLNTAGAGFGVHPKGWSIDAHAGASRPRAGGLLDQSLGFPLPDAVGTESVRVLDRQRGVAAARVARQLGLPGDLTLRLSGYAEWHGIPEGTRFADERTAEALPGDRGSIVGVQASAWGWGPDSFAHLWLRRGTGIAIPGTLFLPTDGLGPDRRLADAREHLIAIAGNTEGPGNWGVLWGGYARLYRDADTNQTADWDDVGEGALVLRPAWHLTRHTSATVELSHQWRTSTGVSPRSGLPGTPRVTRVVVGPTIQPRKSGLSRPQLRAFYAYGFRNDDARWLYAAADARFLSNHDHRVGVQAEWWMDSATYRPAGSP